MNKDLLRKMLNEEYIMVQKHPDTELFIYNYTRKCQFESKWNEVTLLTRGLILDGEMNIVARPFIKFFNCEQHKPEEIPNLPFTAFEKMDGSLGILYRLNDQPFMASRGSFQSDQSKHANEVLYSRYAHTFEKLKRNVTYLFEIIFPKNRIVCDYGDMDDLVLLAIIDNSTGQDLPLEDVGFPIVKRYDGVKDWSTLRNDNDMQREGYIVKFSNDFRMKLKYQEYCRLHSIVTNVSNIVVWENLSQGKSFDELLDKTPDEWDKWIRKISDELKNNFKEIEIKHLKKTIEIINKRPSLSRKDAATIILKLEGYNSKIIFEMMDSKNYDHIIWKMIRPLFAKPFLVDDEN